MTNSTHRNSLKTILLIAFTLSCLISRADGTPVPSGIATGVQELMQQGNIPGLSLIAVKKGSTYIQSFGFANADRTIKATPGTLFEIGSCSKAFTALAVLKLQQQKKLSLNDPVSGYLPWFFMLYEHQKKSITLEQLLHHTSGIPFKTIALIAPDTSRRALENTVRKLAGGNLDHLPGQTYEYATINYDVLGLVIEQVSGMPFEQYMQQEIFSPLGLDHTSIGKPYNTAYMAEGSKNGFFTPHLYNAPVFRGNSPAGYVISDATDMGRWLNIQLGNIHTPLDSVIAESHKANLSVLPLNNLSYAAGWMVNPYGTTKLTHEGNNPAFTADIELYPQNGTGVMVLANCGGPNTPMVADYVLNALTGRPAGNLPVPDNKTDTMCSVISLLLGIYVLLAGLFMVYRLYKIRPVKFEKLSASTLKKMMAAIAIGVPYLYGIYLIPEALLGFNWSTTLVWAPFSFTYLIDMTLLAIGITYFYYFFSLIVSATNKYKNAIPFILFLSVISGLANTTVLFIITTSFYSDIALPFLLYYFALAYALYVIAMKLAQTRLIGLTNGITFDIRTFLINKISKTRFSNFQKLSDGRVLTTLNNDTSVLANSANVLINFVTNFITIFSAFIYMTTISFVSTLAVLAVVLLLVWYYYYISKKARLFMEESRSIVTQYMSLLNNLVSGFRELSLHYVKKLQFRGDFISVNQKFRDNSVKASVKFLNSSIIGNSFIMIVLGVLSIVMPRVSHSVNTVTLISFVMVLLYIIGPINAVLGTIQEITMIRVAWSRISGFIRELDPSQKELGFWSIINSISSAAATEKVEPRHVSLAPVESIDIKGLLYEYKLNGKQAESDAVFKLGPLDLSISAGEIVFIIGGNGSGKSTLLHLLTGLYKPDAGAICINNEAVDSDILGEYFSVVFSGGHLFQKIYGPGLEQRQDEIASLLEKLKLDEKVHVKDNAFSTIDLSSGQRKRLALMKCFLEDRQIYMFDEFAADQDPEFRQFFYRELLPEMKKAGKIVIAITHDDHYFDIADKVIKLNYGVLDFVTAGTYTV